MSLVLILAAGITPACAGKSSLPTHTVCALWDHPRVCGEKLPLTGPGWWPWGSPPRVRGKASHHEVCVLILGITPAYAGKRR